MFFMSALLKIASSLINSSFASGLTQQFSANYAMKSYFSKYKFLLTLDYCSPYVYKSNVSFYFHAKDRNDHLVIT